MAQKTDEVFKNIFVRLQAFKGLGAAVLYGTVSISAAFINKTCLEVYDYDYPFFLVLCQMIFTILLLDSLRILGLLDIPIYTFRDGFRFLPASFFYMLHSILSLSALSGMNLAMYGLVKRCSPLITLLLEVFLLKKGLPTKLVVCSITLVTIGFIIAGLGDLKFDLHAYAFGGASAVSQALYLTLVQKFSEQKTSASETLHLNSFNTLPMLLLCSYFFGEFHSAINNFNYKDGGFVLIFILVITIGCFLNFTLFLCTVVNSALATSITGALKSAVQIVIGMFTFEGMAINAFSISGITIHITGALLYPYAKYKQSSQMYPKVILLSDLNGSRKEHRMGNGLKNGVVLSV